MSTNIKPTDSAELGHRMAYAMIGGIISATPLFLPALCMAKNDSDFLDTSAWVRNGPITRRGCF